MADYSMYGIDDTDDIKPNVITEPVISVDNRGAIKAIKLDGQQVLIIDPTLVIRQGQQLQQLDSLVKTMNTTIQTLTQTARRLQYKIDALERELKTKVTYRDD
jgi:hypothetical protein